VDRVGAAKDSNGLDVGVRGLLGIWAYVSELPEPLVFPFRTLCVRVIHRVE
jgi:hypothetical protein